VERLRAYGWPGNIRELQIAIERSVILSSGNVFALDHVWIQRILARFNVGVAARDAKRQIIESALAASRGGVSGPTGAAARLQIPPSTLKHEIKALKALKSRHRRFGSTSVADRVRLITAKCTNREGVPRCLCLPVIRSGQRAETPLLLGKEMRIVQIPRAT
jgi:hypothetical protein